MVNYRSKWEIIREILSIIQLENDAKKTRIMHKAYIDWKNFNKHFTFLLNENFIYRTEEDNYLLTEEGNKLLRKLEDISVVMNKNIISH